MAELAPGLWHWTARHPAWESSEPWVPDVSSYATDDGERLVLFDPLGVPGELEERVPDREAAIVLTAPWHERDAQSLVERLGLPVYTPLPDTAEYLMQTYGITAEQAGDGSPDVVWLLKEGKGEARPYAAGDRLDVGVQAFRGQALIHPDGRTLLTGSRDTKARLWETATGQLFGTFAPHTGQIAAVAFHPNGRMFATGSDDQTARLYEIPRRVVLLAAGCCLAHALGDDAYLLNTGALGRVDDLDDFAIAQGSRAHDEHRLLLALLEDRP